MTVLSKCRAPGLSNDSSMSSLTTASLSNRSGERKRGFHIRTVETLSASTAPGGGIKCVPTCLRGQYATASPLKIKKEKTPIADQLWVFESRNGAAARKRSPSTDSGFEAIFALSLLLLSFALGDFFSRASAFPVSWNNQVS